MTLRTPKAFVLQGRLAIIALSACYIFALHWSYVNIISPHWGYLQYTYNQPENWITLLGWGLALLPALWMPQALSRPSITTYWLLYVLVVIPSVLIPVYSLGNASWALLNVGLPIVAVFGLLRVMYALPLIQNPIRLPLPQYVFWIIVGAATLLSNYYLISIFGLHLNITSLVSSEVYDRRLESRQLVEELGGITGYLLNWQRTVINPLLIVLGLWLRNWWLLGLGLLGQSIAFSSDAGKASLFTPLLMGTVFWFSHHVKRFAINMLAAFSALSLTVTLVDALQWMGDGILSSLFVRRLILTSGLLTGKYFDFFSQNPPAMLGHSIFSNFVQYPYDRSPQFLIGQMYFSETTNANANIWADAFANFGFWGLVVFTLLLALVLYLYDSLSQKMDVRLSASLLVVPSFALTQSAFLTSLSTHGMLLILLVVWCLPEVYNRGQRGAP